MIARRRASTPGNANIMEKAAGYQRLTQIQELVARAMIGQRHVRYLSRIKDLNASVKLAKRAAEEEWSTKETEERVAKLLAKAGKRPGKPRAKADPAYEYDYNGSHCTLEFWEPIRGGSIVGVATATSRRLPDTPA